MRLAPLLMLIFACNQADSQQPENPTGDCEAETDGSRPGYHSLEEGEWYLPDCQAPLTREFWRVFAQLDGTSYIIPRPDAMGLTYEICDGDNSALSDVFDRNGLCAQVGDPSVINAMTSEDALQITHALHQRLVFEAQEVGDGTLNLFPYPPDDDIIAACALILAPADDTESYCQTLIDRNTGGSQTGLGIIAPNVAVSELAPALNSLYGIAP